MVDAQNAKTTIGTIEVLNPVASVNPATLDLAGRPETLDGRIIGLVENSKWGTDIFLTRIRELLAERYPTIRTVSKRKQFATGPATFIDELSAECQLVINAYGD